MRLGQSVTWTSRWFADKGYKSLLLEDIMIRKSLMRKLKVGGIASVEIERSINKIDIIVNVAKPGIVIGRGGTGMEELKKFLEKLLKIKKDDKKAPKLDIRVEPVKDPSLNAYLVAIGIADQLAKRMPAKRIMAQTIERVLQQGAKGVKILLSGRIAGAEIARREKDQAGSIPLHTLRADIDFAAVPAMTRSGYVGVKVWIHKPEAGTATVHSTVFKPQIKFTRGANQETQNLKPD
jgi:small subunit ribosomal protein S3